MLIGAKARAFCMTHRNRNHKRVLMWYARESYTRTRHAPEALVVRLTWPELSVLVGAGVAVADLKVPTLRVVIFCR